MVPGKLVRALRHSHRLNGLVGQIFGDMSGYGDGFWKLKQGTLLILESFPKKYTNLPLTMCNSSIIHSLAFENSRKKFVKVQSFIKENLMKRCFYFCLLVLSLIILSNCATPPAATSSVGNTSLPQATQAIPVPTATEAAPAPTEVAPTAAPTPAPTKAPILPCAIAFNSDRDQNLEVYSMSPDGSNQVNLTNNSAEDFDPVWSPDGSHIAFVSNRESEAGGGYFIYTMQPDGSEVDQVSKETESKYPDWSPLGSQIAYNSQGEIYLVNIFEGTEINLTKSPEHDEQPKFSPDGQHIAWLSGEPQNRQIFVMDLDGGNAFQVTNGGTVTDAEWSVDGRIFTHWNQPDGICFNCVVTADGKEVIDAGGKGTIQQFLPFWTDEGERVELVSADIKGTGHEDITLVSESFPDIFKSLTWDAGNNRNPDTAALCGPYHGANIFPEESAAVPATTKPSQPGGKFVIGYTGSIDPVMQKDFDQACSELDVACLPGKDIAELTAKGVDAIVNASNRWAVMGDFPPRREALNKGIPFFLLNAEAPEQGVYNLSAENEIVTTALNWMFKSMGGQGEAAFYNFGASDFMQQIVDTVLKDFPGISVIKKEASYDKNPFTDNAVQNLIAEYPKLGAIWSSEVSNDLYWGVVDKANSHMPFIECPAREDILIAWKNELDAGSPVRCISFVRPGGTAYEGIYAAYYYLSGLKFRPEMLTGDAKNTLHYAVPEITNETLPEWLGKLQGFRVGDYGMLYLPPMSPEQIKETWFLH